MLKRKLCSYYFQIRRMGGCFSFNRSNVEIVNYTPNGKLFGYLRPNGTITHTIDRTYDVSEIEINLDG